MEQITDTLKYQALEQKDQILHQPDLVFTVIQIIEGATPLKGNGLIEYLLPGAIVGVLIITFGITLLPDFKKFIQISSNAKSTAATETQVSLNTLGSNPTLKNVQITLSDGSVIEFENYPSSVSQSIEAVGVNGTTELLLANMESLIRQLQDQGKLTEEEANLIKGLANRGHELAEVQGLIEKVAENSQGNKEIYKGKFSLDGGANQLSVNDLNAQLFIFGGNQRNEYTGGLVPLNDDAANYILSLDSEQVTYPGLAEIAKQADGDKGKIAVGERLNGFLTTLAQVERSSAVKDPTVKSIINSLSKQIYTTSLGVAFSSFAVSKGDYSPNDLQSLTASTLTHFDSAGICKTGSNEDSGVRCK